jgi:hypothetical protein
LDQQSARQTFIDIAEDTHNPDELDKVLSLTDNMPLAINLIAHLVASESCSSVLSRWAKEKTALISDGYDKRSNLDLSISASLSSPRLKSVPHAHDLLSLLSLLPDGLSDVELVQSKFPINNLLGCRAALIQTALAYMDENKRLKALVPIREYMLKIRPPRKEVLQPLLKHFQEVLELYAESSGTQSSSSSIARISANFANIHNVLQNGLQRGDPDLKDVIYCICYLNRFSRFIGQGIIPLFHHILNVFPQPCDHRLETYVIMELLDAWYYFEISKLDMLVSQALKHLEHFDDQDVKCIPSNLIYIVGN